MARDKNKQRLAQHASYLRNKGVIRDRISARRLAIRQWIANYKSKFTCSCGENDLLCLDFHHIDPTTKEAGLARAISDWSLARIQREIAKCVVICSNCHRKLHWIDREPGQRLSALKWRRNWITQYKRQFVCACGENHPACLDFHHTDPTTKIADVSRRSGWPMEQIKAEIAKCELICSNCHRKYHRI